MSHHLNKIHKCISLCTIVITLSTFSKMEEDCAKYRRGNFYFFNKTTKQRINIERRDSLQIETNEKGDITVSSVTWTAPCEYELLFNYMTPKEVSKGGVQKIFESAGSNIPLRIKVLSGTDDYYVFEASKPGIKNLRDTVWIVK